jgi:hypothetical protein
MVSLAVGGQGPQLAGSGSLARALCVGNLTGFAKALRLDAGLSTLAEAMHRREIEMTYSVDLSDVRTVYNAFTGASTSYRERFFVERVKKQRTVLHFYLTAIRDADVRRLRVRRRHGNLVTSLESKRIVRESDLMIEKDERIESPNVSLSAAADILTQEASIVSSFIKNQHRIELKSGSRALKVSLDQMLPFRPDHPAVLGAEFWHLEIEEKRNWPLTDFRNTEFFRKYLSALQPLLQSKWQSAVLAPPAAITKADAENLDEYLNAVLAAGVRARKSI